MKRYRQRMIALGGMLAMFTLLAVDLITKAWSEAVNIRQDSYFLGLVRLWFTTNPGIAFGIAGDNPVAMAIITAVVIVMCIGIAIAYFTLFRQNAPVRFCLAVIEAGAIGNLIDRLSLGYVRDFVDVRPVGFGVCNLADFFITFGIVVLLFTILFIGKHAKRPRPKRRRAMQNGRPKRRAVCRMRTGRPPTLRRRRKKVPSCSRARDRLCRMRSAPPAAHR